MNLAYLNNASVPIPPAQAPSIHSSSQRSLEAGVSLSPVRGRASGGGGCMCGGGGEGSRFSRVPEQTGDRARSLAHISQVQIDILFSHFFSECFIEIEFIFHIIHPLKIYDSVGFSTFPAMCNHHCESRTLSSPRKNPLDFTWCPLNASLHHLPHVVSNQQSTFCACRFGHFM